MSAGHAEFARRRSVSVTGTAIVAGGSLGGLFAANLLLRAGWRVTVYEHAIGPLVGRGAGIVTQPELLDSLRAAGVAGAAEVGVWIERRVVFDQSGQPIGALSHRQCMTGWNRLYALLRDAYAAAYVQGVGVAALRRHSHGVEVQLSDGRSVAADLLVAADGIRSTVRGAVAPDAQPVYSGYVAWRGTIDEAAMSARTHRDLFDAYAFALPHGEQIVGFPVAGADGSLEVGRRRYSFVWYRAAALADELPRLCTDRDGIVHDGSVPPPLIRPALVAEIREAAERVLPPQFTEVVRGCEAPFFQPIHDLATSRMAYGRAVLLGDAAFVARPHTALGATKAAGDARALAAALRSDEPIDASLARYDAVRTAFGHALVARGRRLGAYMEAFSRTQVTDRSLEPLRSVEQVLRETGMPVR